MRIYRVVISLTCLLIAVVLFREYVVSIDNFPKFEQKYTLYETFNISDWLINYQGGFVRRGLAGEILWQMYQLHPYNVVYAIIGITAVCLLSLTTLCVILFRRMGWPVWMLLFPMFLYYYSYGLGGQTEVRRDALLLLLAFVLYWQYRKYIQGQGQLLVIWVLSVLIVLLHEGVIFSILSFLIVHTLIIYRTSLTNVIKSSFLLWLPVIMALLAVIICHGSEQLADDVWLSWMPCFQTYSFGLGIPQIGLGPSWLSGSFQEGKDLAMELTWQSDFMTGIPAWPFNIYMFLAIYYLFTRMGNVGCRNEQNQPDHVQMSNVFLLQFLFTLPLLGFIGCDLFRSIPLCCITSCFLCFLFPDHKNVPSFVDEFSKQIQQKIERSNILINPWFYYVVLVSLPFMYHCARPGGMLPFIPLDMKGKLLEMVIGSM